MINLEDVARMANARKRPTKAQAWGSLCKLIEDADIGLVTELADLYQWFQPSVSGKPRSTFDWVAQAVANKDPRYYLNYIYVTEDGRTIATDGHRVHVAGNTTDIKPGYYNKNGHKLHELKEFRYPDIDRFFLDDPGLKTAQVCMQDLETGAIQGGNGPIEYYVIPLGKDCAVNTKYLRQATSMLQPADMFLVQQRAENEIVRVLGLGEDCMAALMPIRL